MEEKQIIDVLNERIKEIKSNIVKGKIKLLDYELVPIFKDLKDNLDIINLENSSKTYKNACFLLNQKFEELKNLLSSLDVEGKFTQYLKNNPSEEEISDLLNSSWFEPFIIKTLSLNFLEISKNRLENTTTEQFKIESLNKIKIKKDFILEIQKKQFTEKMMNFYDKILKKLPCYFEDIFENYKDQEKLYEDFVYLLHLLQQNKIKYQKETNTLYK